MHPCVDFNVHNELKPTYGHLSLTSNIFPGVISRTPKRRKGERRIEELIRQGNEVPLSFCISISRGLDVVGYLREQPGSNGSLDRGGKENNVSLSFTRRQRCTEGGVNSKAKQGF